MSRLTGICVRCDAAFDPNTRRDTASRLYCTQACNDADLRDLRDLTAEVMAEDAQLRKAS